MKKVFITQLILLSFAFSNAHGQTIDPTQKITQLHPSQPLAINYVQLGIVNGIPLADQFCGNGVVGGVTQPACSADASVKIRAANQYAVKNNINQVDATHFVGTQACSVDMFGALNSAGNATISLTINLGAVHFRCSVGQTVTNSGVHIHGLGGFATQIEYTGPALADPGAILYVNGTTGSGSAGANGINGFELEGVWIYGDVANATDGIIMRQVNRSTLKDVSIWGVTNCGIHTEGAVTDTFLRPHVSGIESFYLGILNSAHTSPTNGLCFDQNGSNQTTNGTVVDAIAEGMKGVGWNLISANSMTFTSGTSEENARGGMVIGLHSLYNTFISFDMESNGSPAPGVNNTGIDVIDNGGYNFYISPIAQSTCSGPCTSPMNLTGAHGNDWVTGGTFSGPHGYPVGAGFFGFTPFNRSPGATMPAAASGFVQMWVGGTNVYIPYFTTHP